MRDGLAAILSTQPDFVVVGEAGTGRAAVAQAVALRPDILLLDLELPDGDGLYVLEHLAAQAPRPPVLVFTAFDSDERIIGAIQRGAQGYLLKGAPRAELFNAIRVVARGESLLAPGVAARVMAHLRDPEPLTAREREVLGHMAAGRPNKEIARELTISERTVKFHVSQILKKLEATNRTEAVRRARERGLITV